MNNLKFRFQIPNFHCLCPVHTLCSPFKAALTAEEVVNKSQEAFFIRVGFMILMKLISKGDREIESLQCRKISAHQAASRNISYFICRDVKDMTFMVPNILQRR
jgi:hypothetical protein